MRHGRYQVSSVGPDGRMEVSCDESSESLDAECSWFCVFE